MSRENRAHPPAADRAGQASPGAPDGSPPFGDHPLRDGPDVVRDVAAAIALAVDELGGFGFNSGPNVSKVAIAAIQAMPTTVEAYRHGAEAIQRTVNSIRLHHQWGPDATPDDGVQFALAAVRDVVNGAVAAIRARDAGGEAGETPQEARPEGPQPGGEAMRPDAAA